MMARRVAVLLVGAGLLFSFPDLDIRLLGIRAHRYFLFHSAFLVLVFSLLTRGRDSTRFVWLIVNAIVLGCGLGIGAHLAVDVFQSKSVVFPFVGTLVRGTSVDDRLWLGSNAAASFILSLLTYRRIRPRLRAGSSG